MKKIICFTDVHLFAPHEIKVEWEYGPDCYSLGDNVDIRGCNPKDLQKAWRKLSLLDFKFLNRHVVGNHELLSGHPNYLKIGNNTLLTHGDKLFWGEKRSRKYREQSPGSGNFVKNLWNWLVFGQLGKLVSVGISTQFEQNCVEKAREFGINHIICSHIHPPKRKDLYFFDNERMIYVKVTILPRGKHEVEINE